MSDVIRTWTELGALLEKKPNSLLMAWKRGKLPITPQWHEGRRVFDRAEVEALKAAQASPKP